jgi:hypothetical protein
MRYSGMTLPPTKLADCTHSLPKGLSRSEHKGNQERPLKRLNLGLLRRRITITKRGWRLISGGHLLGRR